MDDLMVESKADSTAYSKADLTVGEKDETTGDLTVVLKVLCSAV